MFALTRNLSVEATLFSPVFPTHDGCYEPTASEPGTSFSLVDYNRYRCTCFLTPFTFHHPYILIMRSIALALNVM